MNIDELKKLVEERVEYRRLSYCIDPDRTFSIMGLIRDQLNSLVQPQFCVAQTSNHTFLTLYHPDTHQSRDLVQFSEGNGYVMFLINRPFPRTREMELREIFGKNNFWCEFPIFDAQNQSDEEIALQITNSIVNEFGNLVFKSILEIISHYNDQE